MVDLLYDDVANKILTQLSKTHLLGSRDPSLLFERFIDVLLSTYVASTCLFKGRVCLLSIIMMLNYIQKIVK